MMMNEILEDQSIYITPWLVALGVQNLAETEKVIRESQSG
jgi:hypothetical protein